LRPPLPPRDSASRPRLRFQFLAQAPPRRGKTVSSQDLFADAGLRPAAKPLTVFHAQLIGQEDATWEELFAGFTRLKAITFSSSIEFLVRLADRLDDAEIVFGSESILSKEHLALAQASQTVES